MLELTNHTPCTAEPLNDYLARRSGPAQIIQAIADSLMPIADRLAAGALYGDPAAIVGVNESGDKQKALDLGTHVYMVDVLKAAGVRLMLSEESEEVLTLNEDGAYDVAIDPIDGSGSIGVGAILGMLFTVVPASDKGFLQDGHTIAAAGYASFGHSLDFGFAIDEGVTIAVYDRASDQLRVSAENVTIAPDTKVIAYNGSNARHWGAGMTAYIDEILAGKDGPRCKNYNMRWPAAAVGDLHRILLQGGMFLYPGDRREGYENGRLRLVYEAMPMAYLMQAAGGLATDGHQPILDKVATDGHEHSALIFGAKEEVEAYLRCMEAEK